MADRPSRFRSFLFAIALLCASLSMGCGGSGDASSVDAESPFLALASSFAGFRTWEAFPVPPGSNGGGSVHLTGPRTEYLNRSPPHGSAAFPNGSIVVKESEIGALAERKVFAMVKRGGGFNSGGATGWEWFELENLDANGVAILWRGVGPPAGEMYGSDPAAGCNACHASGGAHNDFVQSQALRLESF